MDEISKTKYVKRTQKDYTMSFKLQVVGEIERGALTIGGVARKYGVQNPSTITNWLRKLKPLQLYSMGAETHLYSSSDHPNF